MQHQLEAASADPLATALDRLDSKALGLVLRLLPPADLQSARLAARAFDEASRARLGPADTLTLTPGNAGGDNGAPDWDRFPQLRRLVLRSWDREQEGALCRLFEKSPVISRLHQVDVASGTRAGSDVWAAILGRAPAVGSVTMSEYDLGDTGELAVLATIAALALRLAVLRAPWYSVDARRAALVTRLLPELRSLEVRCTLAGGSGALVGGAECSCVWEALACSGLTSLEFSECYDAIPQHMWPGLSWLAMRRLAGIELPGEAAELLAAGLPNLAKLSAVLEGDWSQGVRAVFPSLTHAALSSCGRLFARHARIAQMFPSMEGLRLSEVGCRVSCDLAGATSLTRLVLSEIEGDLMRVQPHVWSALPSLPCLRALAIDVTMQEARDLTRLTALEVLSAVMAYDFDESEEEPVWEAPWHADRDICPLLEAAVRMPRLRALRLWSCVDGCLHHRRLARLVASPRGGLAELEVVRPDLRLHDVALIAALPGLARLSVSLAPSGGPDHGRLFDELVREHASGGLRIDTDVVEEEQGEMKEGETFGCMHGSEWE